MRIALGTRVKSQFKMAARSLNNAMAQKISKEIDDFYGKLEMKYYRGIQREDIPQKLAVQDLFKELAILKEQTMKSHSKANLREKLKFKKCDLHHMACSEVSYWKKTLMRRQFLTAKHSHPIHVQYTRTESDRLGYATVRLTGSPIARDLEKYTELFTEGVKC